MRGSSRQLAPPLVLSVLWLAATLVWWSLAFPPTSRPPPWLVSVQAVCFGTGADGLPAPYGWGALIAAPLGMLTVLVVGWGGELRRVWRILGSAWSGRVALAVAAALLLGQTGRVVRRITAADGVAFSAATRMEEPMPEGYARLDQPMPAFALTDATGRTVRLADWSGRVMLLTFAFGHCETVCPVLTRRVASVVRQAPVPRLGGAVMTVDPWRDTPSALPGILKRWALPAPLTLLSGAPARMNSVLNALQVGRKRDGRTGDIDHVMLVYVVDPAGRLAYALHNPSPEWMAEAARRAAGGMDE